MSVDKEIQNFLISIEKEHNYYNNKQVLDRINSEFSDIDPTDSRLEDIQLYIAALSFVINEDIVEPCYIRHIKGEYCEYPNKSAFNETRLRQIEEVVLNAQSNILKLHYGHLLINFGNKHNSIRKIAIDGYYNVIYIVISKIKTEEDIIEKNELSHYLMRYLVNLECILLKRDDTFVNIVKTLISDPDFSNSHDGYIELAFESKKQFKPDDLNAFPNLLLDNALNYSNHFQKIDNYNLGIKLDSRLNTKSYNWNKLIAQEYECMVDEREDLAVIEFAQQSSRYYELAGEIESSKRMAKKYIELKQKMELQAYSSEFDITNSVESVLPQIHMLANCSGQVVLQFLLSSEDIIPPIDKLQSMAVSRMQDSFATMISYSVNDINGNISQKFITEEEKLNYFMHDAFNHSLDMTYQIWLGRLFGLLLTKSHWNLTEFNNFFITRTWYGDTLLRNLGSGQPTEYKMSELINPAFENYFYELEKYKLDKTYVPNFQLCLESLALRIEGILRIIAERHGIVTLYTRRDDNNGSDVTKEKDINMLLRDEVLEELLGEDLYLYLTHLLIHRVGANLRNNIAHAFFIPQNYTNFKQINEILIAVIRLGDRRLLEISV